jgi:HEAT repeat protein
VSYWFDLYNESDFHFDLISTWHEKEAAKALQEMGTNTVPYLLNEAFDTRRDTAIRKAYYGLFSEFPKSWGLPSLVNEFNDSDKDRRRRAIVSLEAMGAKGKGAVPNLMELLPHENKANWGIRSLAISALGQIGSDAAAALPDIKR